MDGGDLVRVVLVSGSSRLVLGKIVHPNGWMVASIVDRSLPPSSTLDPPLVAQQVTHLGLPLPPKHPHSGKQHNAASLPIKTTNYQVSPGGPAHKIVVSLDKVLFRASRQGML
jgi:hypothetical protein